MQTQSLTLNVPDPLYLKLKQRAERTRRTLEEESLDVLEAAIPHEDSLSADLEEAIFSMSTLDIPALRLAAQSRLPTETSDSLESLHSKRRREGLSEAEAIRLAQLVRQYERLILVRARAAALLHERGQAPVESAAS